MIRTKFDAESVICTAIDSHRSSWKASVETEGYLLRMNPPFDDQKLEDAGVNWSNNWNFGKGRSEALTLVLENVREISKAISLCDIDFVPFNLGKHKDPIHEFLMYDEMKADFAERIASVFVDVAIDEYGDLNSMVRMAELQSALFGYAAVLKDVNSIFPKTAPYKSIAFEDHTRLTDIGTFVVFDILKGGFILNVYKDFKDEEQKGDDEYNSFGESGWNSAALLKLILDVFNEKDSALESLNENDKKGADGKWKKKFVSWENVQVLADKKGYIWCNNNMNNISIAKIYEPTEDGSVNEIYCALNHSISADGVYESASVKHGILYRKSRKVDKGRIINVVRDITIDGSEFIHDITGSGKQMAESALRYDMQMNSLFDKLILGGSQWLYGEQGIGQENLGLKVLGGVVLVDRNITPVPNLLKNDLSDHISAIGIESREQSQRMGHVKPNVSLSNRPTKDEVNFINAESTAVRIADIPEKLKSYSKILSSVLFSFTDDLILRASDEKIKETFLDKLTEEFSDMSVKKEDLVKILKCIRSVIISPVMSDRAAIDSAMQFASTGTSRQRLTRMFLSTFGFARRQIKSIMQAESFGKDAELASIENSMFETTREVIFGYGQDHITHLQAHFYKADRKLQGIDNGEDPVRAHLYLTNCLTNTRLHVEAVAKSPFHRNKAKDFIKVQTFLESKLKQLSIALDKMREQAEKEGQKGGGQMTPELQEKFYLDRIKLMEKIKTAKQRTEAMWEMKQQSFSLDQELKKMRVEADIESRKAKTDVEINSTIARKSVEMVS